MPTKQGEHCYRCGAKCTQSIREIEENGTTKKVIIFDCPNRHGEQGRTDAPADDPLPEEAELDAGDGRNPGLNAQRA